MIPSNIIFDSPKKNMKKSENIYDLTFDYYEQRLKISMWIAQKQAIQTKRKLEIGNWK